MLLIEISARGRKQGDGDVTGMNFEGKSKVIRSIPAFIHYPRLVTLPGVGSQSSP